MTRNDATIAGGDASPPGQHRLFGGVPMDINTVDAICNILLVVIGIIGLALVKRE